MGQTSQNVKLGWNGKPQSDMTPQTKSNKISLFFKNTNPWYVFCDIFAFLSCPTFFFCRVYVKVLVYYRRFRFLLLTAAHLIDYAPSMYNFVDCHTSLFSKGHYRFTETIHEIRFFKMSYSLWRTFSELNLKVTMFPTWFWL